MTGRRAFLPAQSSKGHGQVLDIGRGIIHGPYSKGAYNDCSQGTEGDREFQEVKFGWALVEQKEKGRPRNSRREKDLNKEGDSYGTVREH